MSVEHSHSECMALVAEVAQDQCEAVASGWLNCAEREASGLMARGYRCRSCRACEVQKATTSDA